MYYIGYYTTADDVRVNSPAANAKILSISKALAKNGRAVNIISSCTVVNKYGYVKGRSFNVFENVVCKQYAVYNSKIRLFQKCKNLFANLVLFFTLVFKVKNGENVLLYHDIERSKAVIKAKKLKNFRLILEVEEIYSNASKLSERQISIENEIIKLADAYIFPTILLNENVNTDNKPYAIIHGTYQAEEDRGERFNNSKCNIVYAGTLDATKGGAHAAARAAEFLDDNYHLHILGFGTDEDVQRINDIINEVSPKTKCSVTYDGTLLGEEFIKFIQSCDIGLSTQNPNAAFNDTSFPSKILTYMANGIKVVSVKIPVVETSAINEYMYYYEEQTPLQIAQAIEKARISKGANYRAIIENLDKEFTKQIFKLFDI